MRPTETLLLPTGITLNGEWESSVIDISHKKNKQLLDLIRDYGLRPKARNKESYKKCLEDFSNNPESWDELKRPQPNMHKGPRRGRLASALKNPLNAAQHAAHSEHIAPQDSSNSKTIDTRGCEKIVSWAVSFMEKDAETQCQATTNLPAIIPRSSTMLSLPSPAGASLANLVSELQVVHNATQALLHVALDRQVLLEPAASIRDAHDGPFPDIKADSEHQCNSQDAPVTLLMQAGTVTILSTEIPDPPPLSCHGNVELINAMWDDDPASWNHSSPLRINGVSIPLLYWRALYGYRRSKQWSGLKQRWSEYKFLVHEFRSLGKGDFWMKYSANGAPMPMSTILKALRKARKGMNDATAENARRVFGENFDQIFCYHKNHTTSVIHNDGAIARRYHALLRERGDVV